MGREDLNTRSPNMNSICNTLTIKYNPWLDVQRLLKLFTYKMMDNYLMFNFCLKWISEGITFALKVRAIREWKVEDAARRVY